MVSINASDNQTVGVREDGTVLAVGENDCGQCNVSGWTDIVAAATGYKHTVGLKANGTVTFTGQDFWGDSKVQNMTDIVSIATGCYHVVGLKSDGTVYTASSSTIKEVYSAVTLDFGNPFRIRQQPTEQAGFLGDKVKFTVGALGQGLT